MWRSVRKELPPETDFGSPVDSFRLDADVKTQHLAISDRSFANVINSIRLILNAWLIDATHRDVLQLPCQVFRNHGYFTRNGNAIRFPNDPSIVH